MDQTQIGTWCGIKMFVPNQELNNVIGKVAHFRRFGNMLIYVGYGDTITRKDGYVSCFVHPRTKRV